jgi:hypothetical protein
MSIFSSIVIPDTLLAKEATDILREHSTELLLITRCASSYLRLSKAVNKSFASTLNSSTACHDFGLIKKFSSPNEPLEVDGANAVRQFLTAHNVPEDPTPSI